MHQKLRDRLPSDKSTPHYDPDAGQQHDDACGGSKGRKRRPGYPSDGKVTSVMRYGGYSQPQVLSHSYMLQSSVVDANCDDEVLIELKDKFP